MSEHRDPRAGDRLGPPPVEPLSDLSWMRVERAVFAELDAAAAPPRPVARPHRWAIMAMPLAAAAALVLWLVIRPGALEPHERPARVVTADSPTELSFGEAVITAAAQSTLVLGGSTERGVLVVIERGGATFEVSPRQTRPAFRVQAGDVSIRVVGTRFSVSRSGDAASVQVLEGTVEVVARGRRVLVHAGDSWSSSGEREAAVPGTTSKGVAAAPLDSPPVPAVASTPQTEPAPAATADTSDKDDRRKRRDRSKPRHDDDDEDDDARPRGPTSKEQFEAAAALESTDAAAALQQYRTLAKGTGPWAANALYAAGRLSFDRGDFEVARRLLTKYLRRFPGGGNAADARALLDRL